MARTNDTALLGTTCAGWLLLLLWARVEEAVAFLNSFIGAAGVILDLLYTIRRVVDKPSLSSARTNDRSVGFAFVLMAMSLISLISAGAAEAQTASTQVTEDAEGIQAPDEQSPTDPTQGELGDGPALAPLDWASAEAWADEYFSTELAANRITGAVVGAIEGDDVVFLKGYGWQDLGRQIPLDPKRTMIR
ncbi:MAG: hypothetical protein AAF742_04330, partial [Pseudomonadota bacterium]